MAKDKNCPWPIPPLVDKADDLAWFGWILEMKQRDLDEALTMARPGEDPTTRLVYELSGIEVLIRLWKHHLSTSIYVSERPLNELRRRYVRRFYNPDSAETCTKVLATKLRCSEQFVRECLEEDPREDPRQMDAFGGQGQRRGNS